MELNKSDYQVDEKVRLAEELYELRNRRHFYLFEIEQEDFLQQNLEKRRKGTKQQLRVYCYLLVPFALLFFYCVALLRELGRNSIGVAMQRGPFVILTPFAAIVCVVAICNIFFLARKIRPGGPYNTIEIQSKESKQRRDEILRLKQECDSKIQELEILNAKYMTSSVEEIKEKKFNDKFALRENVQEEAIVLADRLKELDSQEKKTQDAIKLEKGKINQSLRDLYDLEINYKHVMSVYLQFGIGLLLVMLMQMIPNKMATLILAIIAYIMVAVMTGLYVAKYGKIILAYHYEQNPAMYKSYAEKHNWLSYQERIYRSKKEINALERDLIDINEKKKALQ